MDAVPVVIVGGGPTGIAAATLLAQHGIVSVVLERWPEIYPQPRAVAADGEVFRILALLGIGAEFAALSRPGLGLRLVDPNLRVLSEFRRNPVTGVNGFPESSMFDQPQLEKAMRANLRAYPRARLCSGAEVTAIEDTPGGRIAVRFTDRGTGEEHALSAAYVLGCDGANSLVRRTIGATMADLRFEQRWLVVDIDSAVDLNQWEGVHQVCSATRAATFMRVGASRYRWEFQLLPGETAGEFQTLADIAPLIAPWVTPESMPRLSLIRCCEYTFRARVADRWRRGNVFLLGDAAHLTPPFIGQGMGAGLRDAMNLAWKLAAVLNDTLPYSILDSYEKERKPHARSMIRFAVAIGWAMTAGGRRGDTLRRWVLPALASFTAAADSAVSPALRGSALVRRHRRRGDLAGTLTPNPLLGPERLDERTGVHAAVITRRILRRDHRERLRSCGVTVVEVHTNSELGRWLRRGHADIAVVRPDRTVLSAGTGEDELCSTAMTMALTVAGRF